MSRTISFRAITLVALANAVSLAALPARAQQAQAAGSVRAGVYATSQAAQGNVTYRAQCIVCHGPDLKGTEGGGPPLVGEAFMSRWAGKSLQELFVLMRKTMPTTNPAGLSDPEYAALLSSILQANGLPAGVQPLPADATALASVMLQRPSAGEAAAAARDSRAKMPKAAVRKSQTEWLVNRGDAGSTSYSPLAVIDRTNVAKLRIVWRWKSDNFGPAPEYYFRATPLMANGVLYTTAGLRRDVVAIDAVTGETLWVYRMDEGERGELAPRPNSGRGLAFWRDPANPATGRVIVISPGYQMMALDALTGRPIADFGRQGVVDLRQELDQPADRVDNTIGSTSPPVIVKDVIVVGASFSGGGPLSKKAAVAGHIRGYDVRTGARKWIFHTIPQPGEFGNETWENGSWRYVGNTGVWSLFSADTERGLVYLPVESPTDDLYGGPRHGNNLFGNSLVCLDATTGKRVWHFQISHHDIWDYDLPAAPVLVDITVNGKRIPAVAQSTKQAFLFVFDRVTGKPVWPIKERRVPQSDAPGEKTSPTQPFPTLPEPFDRQGLTPDDLIDFTPEIKAKALEIVSHYRMGPIYTPPSMVVPGGNRGTLAMPNISGGGNWQGAAVDPETGILYVGSISNVGSHGLARDPSSTSETQLVHSTSPDFREGSFGGPFGLPLVKPPWGRITAINLNTGMHVWMVPNSDAPSWALENPQLKGVQLPRTGSMDQAGLLVTRTLLFAGEGSGLWRAGGGGKAFRAYDKQTGEILSTFTLPANQTGVPMTYEVNGKQFIVLAVGARGNPGELVALSVP
jgi:quinoprotein glucose dehydrogenase